MLLRFARHQYITVEDLQLEPDTGELYAKIDFREFDPLKKFDGHIEIEEELRQAGVFGDNTHVTIFANVLVLGFMDSTAGNLFMERFNKYMTEHAPKKYHPDSIEQGDPISDTHQMDLDGLLDAWRAADDPDEKARLETMMNIKSRSKVIGKSMRFASELKLVRAWPEHDIHLYYAPTVQEWYVVMTYGIYQVRDMGGHGVDLQITTFGDPGYVNIEEVGVPQLVENEIGILMGARMNWQGGNPALED